MPPIASRRSLPDRPRVGGDGEDHEHQEGAHHDLPQERLPLGPGRQRRARVGDVAERSAQERSCEERARDLRAPVGDRARPREVAGQREGEGHGRIEVRAADVADRVDPEHDHQPEADRHTHMAELMRLGVHHHRATTREDERERTDRLGNERPRESRSGHSGSNSATSRWTRSSISSRIVRTVARSWPAGSSSSQSSYFLPG